MKTSQKNKKQISILSPLELGPKELEGLYRKVKKGKGKLLVLAVLPDKQNLPAYLNELKDRIAKAGSGLRIIWSRDVSSSRAGLVRAIQ